ncbi:secoisolariciresinol dehydrogenase-like protein [Tanacetum coccineum]
MGQNPTDSHLEGKLLRRDSNLRHLACGNNLLKDTFGGQLSYLNVKNAVDTAISTYGKLDILFNNAGLPVMVPAKSGSILTTASVVSNIGGASSHAYCCAKHAVVGLTKNLAVELGAFGIRVNCLSPSALVTPLSIQFAGVDGEVIENVMNEIANLKGTTLKTDDVANAALFLASDEAKYISGQNLFVDGGFNITNPSLNILKYPENQ